MKIKNRRAPRLDYWGTIDEGTVNTIVGSDLIDNSKEVGNANQEAW